MLNLMFMMYLLWLLFVVVCCCCLLLLLFVFKSFDAGVVLCGLLAPAGPLSRASLVGLCPDFNADSNIYIMTKCSCVTKNDHLLELHQKGQLGPPVSDEK